MRAEYSIEGVSLIKVEVEKDLGPGGPAAEVQGAGSDRRRKSQQNSLIRHSFAHIDARTLPLGTLQNHGSPAPGVL